MPKKKVELEEQIDKRPESKPRKHPQLWQSYQIWDELMKLRQRHTLRISSAERGKSGMDAQIEYDFLEDFQIDYRLEIARKMMINYGKASGPIWNWATSIKGLGAGGEAAKLIAQVDDIARFDSIAKLWRFAGYALYEYWLDENGKIVSPTQGWKWKGVGAEREKYFVVVEPKPGWTKVPARDRNMESFVSPYNKTLKSTCFIIADQFIRQQTPGYVDIYYAEKARQRVLYPEPVKDNGKTMYNDGHLHNRAWRKMIKQFLADFWLQWRVGEGLPISEPFAER